METGRYVLLYLGLIALCFASLDKVGPLGVSVVIPTVTITLASSIGVWRKFELLASNLGNIAFFIMVFALGVGLGGVLSADVGKVVQLWPALIAFVSLILWRTSLDTKAKRLLPQKKPIASIEEAPVVGRNSED